MAISPEDLGRAPGRHADRHRRQARRGLVVLFHVTADTTWSNLPLSGLFVDMLRRVVGPRRRRGRPGAEARNGRAPQTLAAAAVLDGYGSYVSPPPTARPVSRHYAERATDEHPPGFYGPADGRSPSTRSRPATGSRRSTSAASTRRSRRSPAPKTDRPARAAAHRGAAALLVDTLASLWLSGHLANRFGRLRRARLGGGDPPRWRSPAASRPDARAQERAPPPTAAVAGQPAIGARRRTSPTSSPATPRSTPRARPG